MRQQAVVDNITDGETLIQIKVVSSRVVSSNEAEEVPPWSSQFTMFPLDENGWSIIKPQQDSRLIYVSSTGGNDSLARAYSLQEIIEPDRPLIDIVPFKTIGNALKLIRDGYADWVLLKKGDEWLLNKDISLPSGRATNEHTVLTSYGSAEQRPLIKTGVTTALVLRDGRHFVSVIGIEFYANQRDPDSSDFVGWENVKRPIGFLSTTFSDSERDAESIHLEDNVFNFYANNVQFSGERNQKNIVVRRNQLLNAYSVNSHSEGMFARIASMLIEENLFDHNGWYQQNYEQLNATDKGQATYFNHNAYLGEMMDTVIKGNIFSRSSSIGIKLTANGDTTRQINSVKSKNIVIDDNLIIEGEVAISAGGNKDFNNGYRWKNMTIINNVMVRIGHSKPTRRGLGWHVDANDWDGGTIEGNYLLCNNNPLVTNILGISVYGLSRNISVANNVIYGLQGDEERMMAIGNKEAKTGVDFNNNFINKDALCAGFEYSSDAVIDDMINGAKAQSRSNWISKYTASDFNARVKSEIDTKI